MITQEDINRFKEMNQECEDIQDDILIVFQDPASKEEVEITVMNLIEGGTPIDVETDEDFILLRVIKREKTK